jgi:hypothetical protein
MSEADRIRIALAGDDPERLLGPALLLLTWLASGSDPALRDRLRAHLLALALHPEVSHDVRLCAGSLAMEPRCEGCQ